jgi:hypothetical protein
VFVLINQELGGLFCKLGLEQTSKVDVPEKDKKVVKMSKYI